MSDNNWKTVPPPIDFTRLQMVAETDNDKAMLVALFFRMAKEAIANMENIRRSEDFRHWKNVAHSLRGSSANLGAADLEELCRQAENAAGSTYEQRSELLTQVRDELQRIKAYIADQNPSLVSPEA